MTDHRILPLLGSAVAIMLAGCTPTRAVIGANFYALPSCKDLIGRKALKRRTVAFELDAGQFKADHLGGRPLKKRADASGEDTDPTDPGAPAMDAGHPRPTRWDFDIELPVQPATDRDVGAVVIKVVSSNPLVTLRDDDAVITSGDVAGKMMFCDLKRRRGEARFKAIYFKERGADPTFGKFNIGLYVQDDTDPMIRTPIYVDPNIKNNGSR